MSKKLRVILLGAVLLCALLAFAATNLVVSHASADWNGSAVAAARKAGARDGAESCRRGSIINNENSNPGNLAPGDYDNYWWLGYHQAGCVN